MATTNGNGRRPANLRFTPVQRRLLAVLRDGQIHSRKELEACLDDDMFQDSALSAQLTFLRRRIIPLGRDVDYITRKDRGGYRMVALIHCPTLDPDGDDPVSLLGVHVS